MDGLTSTAIITFELRLHLLTNGLGRRFRTLAALSKQVDDQTKVVRLELPATSDDDQSQGTLASQCEAAFTALATQLSDVDSRAL